MIKTLDLRLNKINKIIQDKIDNSLANMSDEELDTLADMREHASGLFLPKMVAKTPAERALVEKIAEDSKILAALFFDLPEGVKSED